MRRAPVAVVWLLVVLLSCAALVRGFEIDDDLTLFLPSDATPTEHLLLGRLREGPQARAILVALEGADARTRASASRALAEALRQVPGVARVENGERALDRAVVAPLFEHRYLLADPGSFERDALRRALEDRLRELRGPFAPPDKALLSNDPTAQFRRLLDLWRQGTRTPARAEGVFASPDGARALLVVDTAPGGFELSRQAAVVADIRRALRAIESRYGVQALISGPTVFAVDARAATRSEAVRFSAIGSGLVVGLLLLAFRSLRVVILGIVPLATGALLATAAVHLAFGSIHGISLAFGITLLGVAIDYPLHLFSHASTRESLETTAATVWRPLRLGLLTTVLGYGAMATPDFAGLAQLGLFASTGLLAAGLCARYVLPALCPGQAPTAGLRLRPNVGPIRPRLQRSIGLGLLVLALVAAAALASRGERLFETDLARLSPIPDEARRLDRELRSALGAPDLRHLLLLRADSAEVALQAAEALEPKLSVLRRSGAIEGYDPISRYLPSQATQRARQAELPPRATLARELAAARQGLPFKPGTFAPFLQAVEESRELAPLVPDDLVGTPLAAKIDGLLMRDGPHWYVFVPLAGVNDPAAVARLAKSDAALTYADLKQLSEAAVTGFRDRALQRLAIGAGVILLVLIVSLPHWRRVLAVGGSLVLALMLATAVLVALGERLSLFHIVAGLLVVGIGVDYSVFLGWPEEDLERRRTLGAVLLCALSTITVFGVMTTSSTVVLHAIGLTVTTGTIIAFVCAFALVWSPSLPGADRGRASDG